MLILLSDFQSTKPSINVVLENLGGPDSTEYRKVSKRKILESCEDHWGVSKAINLRCQTSQLGILEKSNY